MLSTPRQLIVTSAILGACTVALGAFGAHTLKDSLDAYSMDVFTKAATYQMYHVLALLAVGVGALHKPSLLLAWAGRLFVLGIVLFSGSLYALALSHVKVLGAITPFGGVAFIAGWICVAMAFIKQPDA